VPRMAGRNFILIMWKRGGPDQEQHNSKASIPHCFIIFKQSLDLSLNSSHAGFNTVGCILLVTPPRVLIGDVCLCRLRTSTPYTQC
jgi:hypothetical protein